MAGENHNLEMQVEKVEVLNCDSEKYEEFEHRGTTFENLAAKKGALKDMNDFCKQSQLQRKCDRRTRVGVCNLWNWL